MKTKTYDVDLCVIGGGLAGLCCAISASRCGIKTLIMQDRPVFGGNASEEIRMWICGATGKDNRETGIIEEMILENFYYNKELRFPIWSGVMYGKAINENNLTVLLNTSCLEAKAENSVIKSVKGWQSNAETYHVVNAKYFADCSGDSILSTFVGAEYTYGREGKKDYNESIPPEVPDKKTMGMSCMFQIREMPYKVDFIPPSFAYKFKTDDDLPFKDHYIGTNFWWIEVGGEWDCIHDTDRCREELLKISYGVWDHVKNYGDHGADNWDLDWIGFLPGKRESRRYIGKYVINQNDVESGGKFDDVVAYGGWAMDDHFPEGFYFNKSYPTIAHPAPSPWGIPFRALISKNIKNLLFAGRNISVTHSALSSSRVMATCAILGQAVGTAVAQAVKDDLSLDKIDIKKLQQKLLHDDCYIPFVQRDVSSLTKNAKCSSNIVRNGLDRGEENLWLGGKNDFIEYSFNTDTLVKEIRIVFDSDLNRDYHNMPCNYPLVELKYKLPKTLIRNFKIEYETEKGVKESIDYTDNFKRFILLDFNKKVSKIRLVPLSTWGEEKFRVFSFELN